MKVVCGGAAPEQAKLRKIINFFFKFTATTNLTKYTTHCQGKE